MDVTIVVMLVTRVNVLTKEFLQRKLHSSGFYFVHSLFKIYYLVDLRNLFIQFLKNCYTYIIEYIVVITCIRY